MKILKLTGICASVLFALNANAQCDNTNLSAWSVTSNPDTTINVTAGSAMGGTTCGLEVAVNTSTKNYVADQNPNSEQRYRQALCVDPNSITMPTSGTDRRFKFHNAQCTVGNCASTGIVQFKLENTPSGYSIKGYVKDLNSNASKNKYDVPLTDGPNRVEYDVDLTNGTFKLWVNATAESDAPVVNLTGLDLSAWTGGVSEARFGQVNKPVNLTVGQTIFIDEAESRRQTFIGGTCN